MTREMNPIDRQLGDGDVQYRIIGRGSGGTVFEVPKTELAIKKGANTHTLWNDFNLTYQAHKSFTDTKEVLQDTFPQYTIPRVVSCLEFWPQDAHGYWDTNLQRYPPSHQGAGAAFSMDKLPSLPRTERERLIDKYFDEDAEVREAAKIDEFNQHCLVRVYLGENESGEQATEAYDSLENFPMRLNMVEDFLQDKRTLAAEMAIALAVIHWQAQIDAMDCEFVLASHPATTCGQPRELKLWVLDFDKASSTDLTPEDVEKRLVPTFLGNDPYYPRPDVDKDLWDHFSNVYREASDVILSNRPLSGLPTDLPRRFLGKVEAMIKQQKQWDLEEQVVFGN